MRKYDLILLLAAVIWGFAFVAQRAAMEHMGPFSFNAIRFALGALVLVPFLRLKSLEPAPKSQTISKRRHYILFTLLGLILFGGISFQQVGIVSTTAGNAGFITGLYVIFVPLFGLVIGQKTHVYTWFGAILALAGMYLLSFHEGTGLNMGDLLVFVCAIFWGVHVLFVGWLAPQFHPIRLAFIQFAICALLSAMVAAFTETISFDILWATAIPVLYGGILSVGVAYTLQVIAQRKAHPAYAGIVLSTESVFAVFGGWLILQEAITLRILAGCILMFAGMLLAQRKSLPTVGLLKK